MLRSSRKCLVHRGNMTLVSHDVSLRKKHGSFLDGIRDHGLIDGGRVKLNYINGNVADVKICNIGKKNAISGIMMNDLADIVDDIVKNDSLVGIILRGEQDFFCSGADLSLAKDYLNTPEAGLSMSNFMTDALNRLRNSNVVSVGMLNGPCLGGGSEISTVPDFRIMSGFEGSQPPYICFVQAKLGVTPGWGGAGRLTSIVGRKRAIQLLGSSMKVEGSFAKEIGLVDDIVCVKSEDEVVERGLQFLAQFTSQRFPSAVRDMKRIVSAYDLGLHEASNIERVTFGARWAGKENSSAFSEIQKTK